MAFAQAAACRFFALDALVTSLIDEDVDGSSMDPFSIIPTLPGQHQAYRA